MDPNGSRNSVIEYHNITYKLLQTPYPLIDIIVVVYLFPIANRALKLNVLPLFPYW